MNGHPIWAMRPQLLQAYHQADLLLPRSLEHPLSHQPTWVKRVVHWQRQIIIRRQSRAYLARLNQLRRLLRRHHSLRSHPKTSNRLQQSLVGKNLTPRTKPLFKTQPEKISVTKTWKSMTTIPSSSSAQSLPHPRKKLYQISRLRR